MKVIVFGASGMVGQGVLRECLLDPDVENVLSVGRSAAGQAHPKLRELMHRDFLDFSAIESSLAGFDACFFCLGVSSAGMREADYSRVTYDFTMAAARVLARLNPGMTFVYVSGMGTDSSERGRTMWARVKGKTENDLLQLPFRAAYMFRPGLIVPLHGIRSKTRIYRWLYVVLGPVLPLLNAALPRFVTTTAQVGRAMIKVARKGAPKPVLENADINRS
ncbi:MAG TPA: NAD-dependent epimerase/dehydratase family protein [Bryobacteraceae bacterium]|nr:NAD-dependent epimerase/dehydratase family protein [Bryobacteraceae bacterium]